MVVQAVEKRLARPEVLVNPGDRVRQRLRPPRALRARGPIGPIARGIVKMRNGNEDFHAKLTTENTEDTEKRKKESLLFKNYPSL
jgi:hypothetical protein